MNLPSIRPLSNVVATPPTQPNPKPRRRFWRRKRFWVQLVFLGTFYFLYFNGKPLTVSPETTVVVAPLTADGKTVDFRKLFDDAQDAWLGPPQENGYRLILQSFGPRAFDQNEFADAVRWDDFPTNEQTRDWFAGDWTKRCEKFELDPAARPTFFDRLDLETTLRVDGIAGTEPIPAENSDEAFACGKVWVDGAEIPARISKNDASDVFDRLIDAPWTAEEYPTAARWLDANADVFAVYEQALDAPRFGCRLFVGDAPFAWFDVDSSEVRALRFVARNLKIRANFRIASGDVDGAIADRRFILRLSRSLLDNPTGRLIENLIGLALYSIGTSVEVGANPNALPTSEQLARDAENWRETFGEFDFEAAWNRAANGERLYFFTPIYCAFASTPATRRLEALRFSFDGDPTEEKSKFEYRASSFFAFAGLDNDAFARRINAVWAENIDDTFDEERFQKGRESVGRFLSPRRKTRSEAVADMCLELTLPAILAGREAFRRADCVAKITKLQQALLQYQAENGSLPPAFTVDADGRPIQSWRVLILPYLGEKEKELYSKIRLNESWDSEYNRQFQAEAPDVFRCPSGRRASPNLAPGAASYSVVVGPNSLFDRSGVGKKLSELAKNPEKSALSQALIVERTTPVCWTRPDAEISEEIAFETGINNGLVQESAPQDVLDVGIGSFHPGGANFALASEIRFFSDTTERRYDDLPDDDSEYERLLPPLTLETLILGVPRPKNVPATQENEPDVSAQ